MGRGSAKVMVPSGRVKCSSSTAVYSAETEGEGRGGEEWRGRGGKGRERGGKGRGREGLDGREGRGREGTPGEGN